MSAATKTYYTPEEYLELERKAEYKSEYFNGRIYPLHRTELEESERVNGQAYAMSGASRAHNLITLNIGREVSSQLKGRPCETYVNDMRVKVSPSGLYTYPDVVAVWGEPQLEDRQIDTLVNPTVIIEVLSPSTEAHDRGEKFAQYRKLESLVEYVLVAQDKVRVEHYVRQGDEGTHWVLTEISGQDGTLQLGSIGCAISLSDIYDKVSFPANEVTT
ncbi:MAG TPA: Uma2 family endonuclease [Chloroflexia bacterium]|nr:Uma2 family endonuclease [Chloroflexia bacterium]